MNQVEKAATELEMVEAGKAFSHGLKPGDTVHLSGDLGVGKTTFVRGILNGLGYFDAVLSPTFSVVEVYQLANCTLNHFDLYRLESAQELDYIGFRDYFTQESIIIIEWPERAMEILAVPDYDICIQQQGDSRLIYLR